MITRKMAGVEVVHAFDYKLFHSCTVAGFTSACGAQDTGGALPYSFTGRMIDRLALGRNYNAVLLGIDAYGDVICSATVCRIQYAGLALGLQHASSTVSTDFSDYSTSLWPAEKPLYYISTATSTADAWFTAAQGTVTNTVGGVMTTAQTTSTSTGICALVWGGTPPVLPLTSAKRYVRVVVAPHVETTGCGGMYFAAAGPLVFGEAAESPATTPLSRVHVTSACST